MDKNLIETFANWILESDRIVFFTGAGVSTESGIPDFRSATGLYRNRSAEEILSVGYFHRHPDVFYDFYLKNLVFPDARPNILHETIAYLEKKGKKITVVTQNIDNLHQKAGSAEVLCLHGSIESSRCTRCDCEFSLEQVLKKAKEELPPKCHCGGVIRPNVVLFGEGLDFDTLNRSAKRIYEADMLVVCGTSLVVHPAASLVQYYRGDKFVIINRDQTPYDRYADILIKESLGSLFFAIKSML